MRASQIYDILKDLPYFAGIYSRDNLPQRIDYPFSIVANTDQQGEPGTHWIGIYCDNDGVGTYFDSYGFEPQFQEFTTFLENNCNSVNFNSTLLQCIECITCGKYVCAYLIIRTFNFTHREFLSLFTNDLYLNDYLIKLILN